MRVRTQIVLLALMLAAGVAGCAERVSVDATVSSSQIYKGESVTYEIQIRGAKEGTEPRPDMSVFVEGYEVVETEHGWTGRSEQMTIINGQVTRKVDPGMLLYRYKLKPKGTGRFVLPRPSVTIDGTTHQAPTVSMNVVAPESQDIAMLEIKSSAERVFPMKAFSVTLKILLKPIPGDPQDPVTVTDPPVLNLSWKDAPDGLKAPEDLKEWLSKLLARNDRGFSIDGVTQSSNDIFSFGQTRLAAFSLYKGREKRKAADGSEVNYYVYELTRTFIAQRPGTHRFSATMKGRFADGFEPGKRRLTGKNLLAVAPEKLVVCEDFPQPKPANFSGAIGQFKLQSSTGAHDLRVGDPLTLKVEFVRGPGEGGGPLEDIAALNISSNAQIAADFSIVEQATSGQIKGGTKSFNYVLRPKKAGVSIPAISASVFNPDSGKYEEISSAAIALNVTEAPQLRPDELVSAGPIGSTQKISGRDKGVFQNISDLHELNKSAPRPMMYLIAVAGLWIAFALFAVVLNIQRARAGDTVWQNRQRASSEAAKALDDARAALKAGHSETASLSVRTALTSLIGRRVGIEPAGMTAQDAETALAKLRVGAESRKRVVEILEQIEASKYGSSSSGQAEAQVAAAEKLIPALQKEMDGKA